MTNSILWLNTMIPIAFSAGPANVTIAAMVSRFGIAGSMRFFVAINAMVFAYAMAIGLDLSEVLQAHQGALLYLQLLGAGYLLFLAYRFLHGSGTSDPSHTFKPRFIDGVVMQLFNMKLVMTNLTMFSHFLDMNRSLPAQVVILSVSLVSLTVTANLIWALSASWVTKRFNTPEALNTQRYLFSFMLICVALWMLFDLPF
ncbi:LysE family transporter [bacterium]|nr:LysE family transporter [bacterium]